MPPANTDGKAVLATTKSLLSQFLCGRESENSTQLFLENFWKKIFPSTSFMWTQDEKLAVIS